MHVWCVSCSNIAHCAGTKKKTNEGTNDDCYMSNLLTHLKTLWESFERVPSHIDTNHRPLSQKAYSFAYARGHRQSIHTHISRAKRNEKLLTSSALVEASDVLCFLEAKAWTGVVENPKQIFHFGLFDSAAIGTDLGSADKQANQFTEYWFSRETEQPTMSFRVPFFCFAFHNCSSNNKKGSGLTQISVLIYWRRKRKRKNKLNFHNLSSESAAASKPFLLLPHDSVSLISRDSSWAENLIRGFFFCRERPMSIEQGRGGKTFQSEWSAK